MTMEIVLTLIIAVQMIIIANMVDSKENKKNEDFEED